MRNRKNTFVIFFISVDTKKTFRLIQSRWN